MQLKKQKSGRRRQNAKLRLMRIGGTDGFRMKTKTIMKLLKFLQRMYQNYLRSLLKKMQS